MVVVADYLGLDRPRIKAELRVIPADHDTHMKAHLACTCVSCRYRRSGEDDNKYYSLQCACFSGVVGLVIRAATPVA